jgi:hypothetical protein
VTAANSLTKKPAIEDSAEPALRHEKIARRAYEMFLARGAEHGRDLDDWLQAERELLERSAGSRAASR